jgi:hypothetical protein
MDNKIIKFIDLSDGLEDFSVVVPYPQTKVSISAQMELMEIGYKLNGYNCDDRGIVAHFGRCKPNSMSYQEMSKSNNP